MTRPDTDDLILFGSIGLASIGVALTAFSVTTQPFLAVGLALIVFGAAAAVLALMAAGETP